ncbi:MAG: flagellar biosynthesis protein FlhF [Gammaproteobacteria bacterium]|nr:MAG: flagellar biosynthesis protein FlhF [Gammaproteobacteria bacterium]
MKIKRVRAADVRGAMRAVRERFGEEAVILSNRRTADGVELIVGVGYDAGQVESWTAGRAGAAQTELTTAQWLAERAQRSEPAPTARPAAAAGAGAGGAEIVRMEQRMIEQVRRELGAMSRLMQDQMDLLGWQQMCHLSPLKVQLLRRLTAVGLGSGLCRQIVAQVGAEPDMERAWRRALAVWAARLRVVDAAAFDRGGIVTLLGPTGVGKTTTAAKLAARFAARHGRQSVLMIANDDRRIGAHEQLLSLGRALGIGVVCAADERDLRDVLAAVRNKRLILIDTAGMQAADWRRRPKGVLLDARLPIRRVLVLSAATQLRSLDETARAYSETSLAGCVLTKLDEAGSLGGVLTVAVRYKLPLAFVSHGPRVPEDLQPARVSLLLGKAVALARRHASGDDETLLALRHGRFGLKAAV